MNKESASQVYLAQDFNCAESVLRMANEDLKLGIPEKGLKLVGGYGGGFGCGMTCGALCGAMAAISAAKIELRAHEDPNFKAVCSEFVKRFQNELGGVLCDDLKPRYQQEGKRCLAVVERAVDLVEAYIRQLDKK